MCAPILFFKKKTGNERCNGAAKLQNRAAAGAHQQFRVSDSIF